MSFATVKKITILLLAIILLVIFSYTENNFLTTTKLEVESDELPEAFDGYSIVHLSDLHSKWFGGNQSRLVRRVDKLEPDLIVFTGDLIDHKRNNYEAGVTLLSELEAVAPVYYVTGNHEWWAGQAESLSEKLSLEGVTVLKNEGIHIRKQDERIALVGIEDPASGQTVDTSLQQALHLSNVNTFKVLLSHRPESLSTYLSYSIDLVLSGHAHGGQVRLPFVGGLIAPDQGVFPEYTSGKYVKDGTVMVVSRGLGNSIIPQRIFNRPQIIEIELQAE